MMNEEFSSELIDSQKNDSIIGPVFRVVALVSRPTKDEWKSLKPGSRLLMQQFKKLVIENGRLVRKTSTNTQIVLPEKFHKIVFSELHEKLAHLCAEKVIDLA